jgi:hypothetical protein
METNSKIADLFEKVHVENHQHFQSLNERYEKVQREMNDLKVLLQVSKNSLALVYVQQ